MYPSKKHIYSLIVALFVLGFGIFLYKHFILKVPLTDTEQVNSWTVEANLHFVAQKDVPLKVSFMIPGNSSGFELLDEYFVAQNYGVAIHLDGYNRQAIWSLRRSVGTQSLYYRAIFKETDNNFEAFLKPPGIKTVELSESKKTALKGIARKVRLSSADIITYAQSAVKEINKREGDVRLLLGNDFSESNIVKTLVQILNHANIQVLPISGIFLDKEKSKIQISQILAVFNGKKWLYLNPHTAVVGLAQNFLIWSYGDDPMFQINGGKKPQFNITVSKTPLNALTLAKDKGLQTSSQLLRFSLLQLPVNSQETYKILLMLPVGAFIILLLRNFIGINTFGTFMPILIALAFRETQVLQGTFLFVLIISFGLLVRFYLDQLKLLLIPRLAAILTVVILLIIFLSVLGLNLNLEFGLSLALFPMVVLTMTIERMCIIWDERGARAAIVAGIGSLTGAILSFAVMGYQPLQYLIFAFPELLFALLGLIILSGQYRGFRLVELIRFSALTELKNVGDLS